MFPELEEQIVKLMGWEELPGTVDQVKSFCCEECFRRVKVGRLKNETNFLPIWRCVICSIQHEDPSFPKVNRDATIEYINYLDEYLNTTKANQPRILKQAFRLTSRAVTNVSGVYDGEFALFLISHLQVCEVNDVSKFWEMMETDIGGEDGWYKGLEDGIKRHLKNHKKYTLLCNLARRQANPAKHAQGLQGLGITIIVQVSNVNSNVLFQSSLMIVNPNVRNEITHILTNTRPLLINPTSYLKTYVMWLESCSTSMGK